MYRCQMSAYEGQEPYLFVSYSHKDADMVLPILDELAARGYRVWYDGGIAPGSEWPEYIATHVSGSALVLAFVSPNSVASPNCRREVNFALSENKPFVGIYLTPTEMSPGMKLQFSTQQCILKYNMTEDAFYGKLCDIAAMSACLDTGAAPAAAGRRAVRRPKPAKKKSKVWIPILIIAVLLIAAALAVVLVVLPKLGIGGNEKEEPVLEEGWYEILDEDEATVGYLYSTGKKLTVYDEDGEELMEENRFSWDAAEEAFFIDDAEAFGLETEKKTITFTVPKNSPVGIGRGEYTLEEIDEEDVPVTEEEPEETEAAAAEPETPAEEFIQLQNGSYLSKWNYEDYSYYFVYNNDTVTTYDINGELLGQTEFVYDTENGTYTDNTGEVYTVSRDEEGNQRLDSDQSSFTLYAIDPAEIPTPSQGSGTGNDSVVTGEPFAFVTDYDGTTAFITVPDLYSVPLSGDRYLNMTEGNIAYSREHFNADSDTYSEIMFYIEFCDPIQNMSADDARAIILNSLQNDGCYGTNAVLELTDPKSTTVNGIDYYYSLYSTFANGTYHQEALLCANIGNRNIFVVLHYWTYTEALYESSMDVLNEMLKGITVS